MDPATTKRAAPKSANGSAPSEEPGRKKDRLEEKCCKACHKPAMKDKGICGDYFSEYMSKELDASTSKEPLQESATPSTSVAFPYKQSLMLWINSAVSQTLKETVLSTADLSISNKESSIQEISSEDLSSSDDEETGEEVSVFDQKHLHFLMRAIKRTLNVEDTEQPTTSILFSKKKKTVFPIHKEVQDLVREEWTKVSKSIPVEKHVEKLYPFSDDMQEIWNTPPSVDAPVARLSRKTALPIDDVSALKHPMDRRIETELKKCYMSSGAAVSLLLLWCQLLRIFLYGLKIWNKPLRIEFLVKKS
ncbi:uncharacterized protein LOC116409538 [Xenopus tropicalis]|uniref:Uncharacterized protein LOC116409538 n=1 Tax=Xenopus tropicalis TaxID=8364 RepID=A0A8J1J883_XENTR|nr:uncharacterized protein LOC116409538 [Xenopus tropicalis]